MAFFKFEDEQHKIEQLLFSNCEKKNCELVFYFDQLLTLNEQYAFVDRFIKPLGDIKFSLNVCLREDKFEELEEKPSATLHSYGKFDKEYEGKPIVCLGRSLYLFTNCNTDIQTSMFYDLICNQTSFYSTISKSRVHPLDRLHLILNKGTFEEQFALDQLNKALYYEPERVVKLNLTDVIDPNEFLKQNMEEKEIAWDLETGGFDFISDKIKCMTVTFDGITGYYLDGEKVDRELLNKFLSNKHQIGNNLKFDCKFFRNLGIVNAKVDEDNLNLGHLINETRMNGLKNQAWYYTEFGGYELPLEEYKKKHKGISYYDIPKEILFPYATMDAIISFRVNKVLRKLLNEISNNETIYNKKAKWKLRDYYYKIVIPAVNAFIDIEQKGIIIDWEKLKQISIELDEKSTILRKQILEKLKCSINLDSLDQLGRTLEQQGWPDYGRGEKGIYKTDKDTLQLWANDGYDIAKNLLLLRNYTSLMKTFIGKEELKSGFFNYRRIDNKIHGTFYPMLADSGRGRSSEPNLQNIPKHGDLAKWYRQIFIPPADYNICEMDGAGLQLRIGAILSQDERMKDIFCNLGGDMHSITSSTILLNNKISIEEFIKKKKQDPYKELRNKSKIINFGFEFGSTAFNFAREFLKNEWSIDEIEQYIVDNKLFESTQNFKDLIKSNEESEEGERQSKNFHKYWAVAKDIRTKFFNVYKGLEVWINQSIEDAYKRGYTVSSFGAIRRLPRLTKFVGDKRKNKFLKNLENISVNTVVQNFEASLMMQLIVELQKFIRENNYKTYIIGNVHDSIVLYLHKDEVGPIVKKAKEIFSTITLEENNGIPLELEAEIADHSKGQVWGFGEEIK